MLKAACEGLQVVHIMKEVGEELELCLRGDSTASHGTLQRLGTGRIKHLQTRQLWLQERVKEGDVAIEKVPRDVNWADLLTHSWTAANEHMFDDMGISSLCPEEQ